MKSTILCMTDFTTTSGQVIKQACQLAKQLQYQLIILYCYRLKISTAGLTHDIKKLKEHEALEQFAILESDVIKGYGISYEFRAEVGFLIDRVSAHIQKEEICFLILDKKMKLGHLEIFDELLERTRVPIILITSEELVHDLPRLRDHYPQHPDITDSI